MRRIGLLIDRNHKVCLIWQKAIDSKNYDLCARCRRLSFKISATVNALSRLLIPILGVFKQTTKVLFSYML